MAEVRVKVGRDERVHFMNPAEEQRFVIAKLKAAGVPFEGEALLVGLGSGTLAITHNRFEDSFLYIYKG